MATAQQQENMLLTEHFSWPPISLIDDIINTINEVLYRCTDTFETGISSAPPHLLGFADRYAAEKRTPEKDEDGNDVYPDAALEIEEGVLKLETLMENAVDKNFDKLEIWTLRNVLCLPRGEEELARWVRLGHYAGLDARKAEVEGEQWTPEKLYILRRKLIETQKLNAALLAEKTRNEAQIAQLRALLQPQTHQQTKRESTSPTRNGAALQNGSTFAFLTHTPAAQTLGLQPLPQTSSTAAASTTPSTGPTPLTTHTTFTTSQLPYLRQLLSNLRPHLPSTALPMGASLQHNDTATPDSASRERKLYLESQSKRILERRGVDTKEGVEGAVEGGRVRAEEVAALESVVGALGRGRERANGRGEGEVEGAVEGKGEGEAMDVS